MDLEEANSIGNPVDEREYRENKFSVGDRVVALANTEWDKNVLRTSPKEDLPFVLLEGHYGHVVENENCCTPVCLKDLWVDYVHVRWEGTIDNRKLPTLWTIGKPWHMHPCEIEHAD